MKPLIFITGFLGAGKTTLLRTLSTRLGDRDVKVDAILNDYINAGMEAATISESAVSVVPLESGCACCESLDELIAVCRAAIEGEGDLLLLELNGTADPLPVLEAFSLMEETLPFFPRLQVCLIDARVWGKRGDLIPLEKRQLETAGYWMLSHADKVDPTRIREVEEGVRLIAPHSARITVRDFENIVIEELNEAKKQEPISRRNMVSATDVVGHRHDSVHRISHRFTGYSLPLPSKVRRHSIEQLMSELPSWVLRAKALVKLVEEPGPRWLFQRTGLEPLHPPLAVPGVCNVPASLICIGPGLDEAALKSLIKYHFGAV
ncbi:MAG: GTP-binding protein [Verrucomicrobiales bacterium]|nr:GTP-binding protein [Verrucomicrobiales bacterium]